MRLSVAQEVFMLDSLRVKPSPSLESKAANVLRQYLRENFVNGGKIPGEHELSDRLGVNRGTLRGALRLLEQEGLITRRRGDGTYANPDVINIKTRLDDLIEYQEMIRAAGYEPQATMLSVETEEASDEVAGKLNIEPGTSLLVARQVLSADGDPAIYVEDMIPVTLIKEQYDKSELEKSILGFLEEKCYVRLDYTISEIEPCVCSGQVAGVLEMEPCQAVLKTTATCYSEDSKPIMASQSYYKTSIIRFSVLRKRKYL
jgi:GntR family transcriptional regulator